jgi:hypothetical protein
MEHTLSHLVPEQESLTMENTHKTKLLLIEDDVRLARLVRDYLAYGKLEHATR